MSQRIHTFVNHSQGMKKILIPIMIVASVLCGACGKKSDAVPVHIAELYDSISEYSTLSRADQDKFLRGNHKALDAFFKVLGYEGVTDSLVQSWSGSDAVSVFTPAVDSVFPTLEPLEHQLGAIVSDAEDAGLKFETDTYAAVVWGNRRSIVFVDSVMLIALNHYLGANYAGYVGWPEYMRARKTPEQLPYDICEALVATNYPYQPSADASVLSRLVYEGLLIEAKQSLVEDAALAQSLGYTAEQLTYMEKNEQSVWNRLVEQRLIYDTSEFTIERLVSPAPATFILGSDVPPRAGRYIGYRIVESYLKKHGDVRLADMLRPEFYNNPSLLVESGYSGE